MNTTARVTTEEVVVRTSRRRRDSRRVREQFEDWLESVVEKDADDTDAGRAERLGVLLEKSPYHRQRDLADAVDVETRTVQRWLDGGGISKRYWEPLADALDTTVRHLVFGEPEVSAPGPVAQLDRIEAMLEAIMAHLGLELPAETRSSPEVSPEGEEILQLLEADAPLDGTQPDSTGSTSPAPQGADQKRRAPS